LRHGLPIFMTTVRIVESGHQPLATPRLPWLRHQLLQEPSMKKLILLAFAVCAVVLTGALIADSADTAAVAPTTLELSDVLPGTVIDQLTSVSFDKCPRVGIYCLDVYDPVTCSNGVTYSNACYAYVACATGCTPGNAAS